jgi:hypothetical protein
MDIIATERTNGSGAVERVDIVANGTRITIADAPGRAIQLTVVGADGGPIVNMTIRGGPSGGES